MLGWLYRILVGSFKTCNHSWETINQSDLYYEANQPIAHGVIYTLRCKLCGEIKGKKIK